MMHTLKCNEKLHSPSAQARVWGLIAIYFFGPPFICLIVLLTRYMPCMQKSIEIDYNNFPCHFNLCDEAVQDFMHGIKH